MEVLLRSWQPDTGTSPSRTNDGARWGVTVAALGPGECREEEDIREVFSGGRQREDGVVPGRGDDGVLSGSRECTCSAFWETLWSVWGTERVGRAEAESSLYLVSLAWASSLSEPLKKAGHVSGSTGPGHLVA